MKAKASITTTQVTASDGRTFEYRVDKMVNTTDHYIGERLSDAKINRLISSGVTVTVQGKSR